MRARKLLIAAAAAVGGQRGADDRAPAPRPDSRRGRDVALDSDRPRRVAAAVSLAAGGLAPVLVLVRGETVAPELVRAECLPFEVISFVPDPPTTRGEARAVARLVREHEWRRLVVITSSYHVARARLIFRRDV